MLREKKHDEEELQKAIVRNDTVSQLYEKLYEDNAIGKVSDEWFMQLSHKYEVERLELKAKIKTLRQKLSECGQCERDRETFTSAIRRFMRMDRLTAPLLRELIDHIDVFETEGTGKSRTQRIVMQKTQREINDAMIMLSPVQSTASIIFQCEIIAHNSSAFLFTISRMVYGIEKIIRKLRISVLLTTCCICQLKTGFWNRLIP